MTASKILDLSAAELKLGGYRSRPGKPKGQPDEIYFRIWIIELANGAKYTFDYHRQAWLRWVTPSRDAFRSPYWRNASAGHSKQLDAWLRTHAAYIPNTHANRYRRGVASDQ